MRRLTLLLLALPMLAFAQYAQQQPGSILYPHNKNQVPPGYYYGGDVGSGIPTSGLEQGKQLEMNQPGYRKRGPTIYHRNTDRRGGNTVISGPDGTTICRDEFGRRSHTAICY